MGRVLRAIRSSDGIERISPSLLALRPVRKCLAALPAPQYSAVTVVGAPPRAAPMETLQFGVLPPPPLPALLPPNTLFLGP